MVPVYFLKIRMKADVTGSRLRLLMKSIMESTMQILNLFQGTTVAGDILIRLTLL